VKFDHLSKKKFKYSITTRLLFWTFFGFSVFGAIFISEYHDIYYKMIQTKNEQYLTKLINQIIQKKELLASKLLKELVLNIELYQYIETFNLIDKYADKDKSLINAFLIDTNGYVHHQKKSSEEISYSPFLYDEIQTFSAGLIHSSLYVGKDQSYLVCIIPITILTDDWGKLKLVYQLDSINKEKKRLQEQQNFLIFSNLIWIFGVWISCLFVLGITIYIILSRHSKRLILIANELDKFGQNKAYICKSLSSRSDETGYIANKIESNYNLLIKKIVNLQTQYDHLNETYKDTDQINERTHKVLEDVKSGLKKWEHQHNTMFNTSQESLIFLSKNGEIVEVNQTFLNLTGYQIKELKHIELISLIPKEWQKKFEQKIINNIHNNILPTPQEIVIRRKDNTFLYLAITGQFCNKQESETQKILLSGINISFQKNTQLMLKDLDFLHKHGLKDALGRIIGLSELMTAKTQIGKKDLTEWSDIIQKNARKILNLLEQSLIFFKIEADKFELKCRECDLIKIFQRIETDISSILFSKSIEIVYNVNKISISWDQVFEIWADCNLLTLMLNSLMIDIINISPENKKIYISIIKNQEIVINIRSEAILTKDIINDFFSRPIDSSKQKKGAYTALLIAKAHKGSIGIQSNSQLGTEFILILPDAKSNVPQNPKKKSLKILIVDDSPNDQIIMDFYITENSKWTSDIANNGKEAIALFKKNKYDLILMDIEMPVLNGITTIKSIRKIEKDQELTGKSIPKTYIIAFSADKSDEIYHEAIKAGADEYLNKPVEQKVLIDKIIKSQDLQYHS